MKDLPNIRYYCRATLILNLLIELYDDLKKIIVGVHKST